MTVKVAPATPRGITEERKQKLETEYVEIMGKYKEVVKTRKAGSRPMSAPSNRAVKGSGYGQVKQSKKKRSARPKPANVDHNGDRPPLYALNGARGKSRPSRGQSEKNIRNKRDNALMKENERLTARLDQIYDLNPKSFIVANDLGKGKDCRPVWKSRTSMYSKEGWKQKETGVPKTMGCVRCDGCGRKSFYKADGRPLTSHDISSKSANLFQNTAWYCSELCVEVERDSGLHLGDRKGRWVNNATLKLARDIMRMSTKERKEIHGTNNEILDMLGNARKKELEEDVKLRKARRNGEFV